MGTIKVFFKFFCAVCMREVFRNGKSKIFHCPDCNKDLGEDDLIKKTEKIDYA